MQILAAVLAGVLLAAAPGSGAETRPAVASPPMRQPLNQSIVALGDNSWLKMNPPREPAGRNYSGCCWGVWGASSKIWYWGGGHFSYDRNDVEFYDIVANIWTKSYKPERNPWGAKNRWVISPREGSPTARHTYQQVCWWPERKVFFYQSGGDTWQFDPAKMKWTCLAGKHSEAKTFSPKPQGIQNAHCFYSPDLKAPVAVMTTGNRGTYLFDYGERQWQKRKSVPKKAVWQEIYSTYVPALKRHLISQRGEPYLWLYDAPAETWEPVADVPEGLRGSQALAYDATNDVVVVMAADRKSKAKLKPILTWALEPKTLKWTSLTPAGPTPAGFGSWAPLWYDRPHNAFFFLNRTGQSRCETWVYRYKRVRKSE